MMRVWVNGLPRWAKVTYYVEPLPAKGFHPPQAEEIEFSIVTREGLICTESEAFLLDNPRVADGISEQLIHWMRKQSEENDDLAEANRRGIDI